MGFFKNMCHSEQLAHFEINISEHVDSLYRLLKMSVSAKDKSRS